MGIQLDNVWFSYKDRPVFSGVSFEMGTGCFHGVLGPNGSGKTTLLDLISGQRTPAGGRILMDGHVPAHMPARQLARQCALVPQDFKVNFPFTVAQVVMMGRYPRLGRFSAPDADDQAQVKKAMDATGINEFRHRPVTELSGGERQRVVFARALAQDAPTLILDEATSNLDIRHTLSLMALVKDRVSTKGRTVISVLQDINLAARFCDFLLFLKNGKAAAHGPVEEVLTEAVIREVFEVNSRVYDDDTIKCRQVVFL